MPYINKKERERLAIEGVALCEVGTPGQLNYVITKIIHNHIKQCGLRYDTINTVIGVLECAKLELYRMIAAPYENQKHSENGSVSELDKDN
jgi:hypothetical protein